MKFSPITFLTFLCVSFVAQSTWLYGQTEVVGALPGEVVVDNTGSSNYAIPIAVAPGTAGMVPDVSIVYSSQSGNGPLGVGWSIGGLSSISRGPKTYFNDPEVEGVVFSGDDQRFYLDGQRLILVGGGHGATNAEYRTEVDQFSRIKKTSTNTWTVETKDGLKMTYGADGSDDNAVVYVADTTKAEVISWSLHSIEDTSGNYINYFYENENDQANPDDGKNRIRRIAYTGNSSQSLDPYAAIQFNYESTPRPDEISGYAFGGVYSSDNRLNDITVFTDGDYSDISAPSGNPVFVREYVFSYTTSTASGRSLLASVQLFAGGSYSTDGSSASEKLPMTKFTYAQDNLSNPSTLGTTHVDVQFNDAFIDQNNPDGVNGELKQIDVTDTQVYLNRFYDEFDETGDTGELSSFASNWGDTDRWITRVEVDGDRLPEFASVPDQSQGTVFIYDVEEYVNGGNTSYFLETSGYKYHAVGGISDGEIAFGDFNGDLLSDVIYVDADSNGVSTFKVNYGGSGNFSAHTSPDEDFNLASDKTNAEVQRILVQDLNADGRDDVLIVIHEENGSSYEIWRNDAPFDSNAARVFEFAASKYSALAFTGQVLLVDHNADSLADLLVGYRYDDTGTNNNDLCWDIFKGGATGFSASSSQFFNSGIELSDSDIEKNFNLIPGDVNGDGATDITVRTYDKGLGVEPYLYETFFSKADFSGYVATTEGFTLDQEGYLENQTPIEYIVDINGDSKGDLIIERPISTNHKVEFRLSDDGDFPAAADFTYSSGFLYGGRVLDGWDYQSDQRRQFVDVLGTGGFQIGLVYQDKIVDTYSSDYEGIIKFVGFTETKSDVLTKVESGYKDGTHSGLATNIYYEPLTNEDVYVKGSGAVYPVADYEGALYVVSEVEKDNGLGPNYSTLYGYADARLHLSGRGFLGFRIFESYDAQKSMAQKQILAQDWPFTGMQISVENYYDDRDGAPPGDQLMSQVRNVLVVDKVDETGTGAVNDGHTWFPFYLESVEKVFTPGSGNPHQETKTTSYFDDYNDGNLPSSTRYLDINDVSDGAAWNDNFLQDEDSNFNADPTGLLSSLPGHITYGNLVKTVTTYGTSTDDDFKKTETINDFTNTISASKWHLGRLTFSQVYGYMPDNPATKSPKNTSRFAEFTYDSSTGLLLTEKVWKHYVSGSGSGDWLLTTHTRDGYGNVTQSVVSGSGITERTTLKVTDWDDKHRFAEVTENALGHEETKVYDSKLGVVTLLTGPNLIKTHWTYDNFGTVLTETTNYQSNPSIAQTTTTTVSFDNSDPINDFTDTLNVTHTGLKPYTKVVTTAPQTPTSIVYFDKLGREIRSMVEDLDPNSSDKYIVVDTIYDSLGQTVAESEPFFSTNPPNYNTYGNPAGWNQTHFDSFGRPWATTAPDGTNSYIQYYSSDDLEIGVYRAKVVVTTNSQDEGSNTNSHSQVTTTYSTAFGEKYAVIDDQNNTIHYYYDGHGNLIRTDRETSTGTIVKTEIVFNELGQKVEMYDEDMAHDDTNDKWTYSYNVAGELVSQTDPEGQEVTMAYDALGRITEKNYKADFKYYRYYYDVTGTGPEEQGREGALRLVVETNSSGTEIAGGYRESYHFDEHHRPNLTLTRQDGQYYYNYNRYDSFSRVTDTDYFWRPASVSENKSYAWLSLGLSYTYNAYSFNTSVFDRTGNMPVTWRSANPAHLDAKGRLLEYTNGNGTVVQTSFDGHNGLYLDQITVTKDASTLIDRTFSFDHLGNVIQRKDLENNTTEDFEYDRLNRLTNWDVSGSATLNSTATYNDLGNITSKTGITSMLYGNLAGPHAITKYTKGGTTYDIFYDYNGNMVRRQDSGGTVWTANWTQFNKVKEIYLNSGDFVHCTTGTRFTYGPDNQRLTEEEREGGKFTKKQRYLGAFEQILHSADGTDTDWDLKYTKIYVNGYGVYTYDHLAPSSATTPISRHWFHNDHIGSIIGISDGSGTLVEEYAYDAWGKRLDPTDWVGDPSSVDTTITDRGFTGHEIMDAVGLVNMNGRIYDADLGRFLSADPYVQFPDNFQNYNRYTYVNNNPISYNDPSGHFILEAIAFFGSFIGSVVQFAVQIIPTIISNTWQLAIGGAGLTQQVLFWSGVLVGGVMGAQNGGGLSGFFKGALFSAFSAGAAYGVGQAYQRMGSIPFKELARALDHGINQGIVSSLFGGSFSDSFVGSFTGSLASHLGPISDLAKKGGHMGAAIAAALVGGTASVAVGGKFMNGARSSVFQYLFNKAATSVARNKQLAKAQAAFDGLIEEHPDLINSILERNPDVLVVDKIEITKQHTSGSTKVITPGGAYNAKTNTLTLVVGGKSTTMLIGVMIHEGTHIADSLAGMNISGADNYATELNAYRNQTAYLLKIHPGAKAPFIVKGAFDEGAFKTFYNSNRAAYGGRSEYRTIGRVYKNAHCFSVEECLGF